MGTSPACNLSMSRRGGFTMLELAIVIAIAAILGAVAVPRYAKSNQRYQAELTARKIVADIAYARRRACISSGSQAVNFDLGAQQYQLPGVKGLRKSADDYTVMLTESPYNAKIISANFNGDSEVIFDPYGVPDSGGTIVVGVGDYTKTIVLNPDSARAEVQ
ncbi:MAG: type II transport protein [Phycisphaerales bacterium]|jgi:prepilin-type N-terminal cleavage/methylation domain-containing protein|nr:type II transport protein [Phycisphaerales bacterium]